MTKFNESCTLWNRMDPIKRPDDAIPVTLSLVIPVYKNEENISDLVDRVKYLREHLGSGFEVVFVIDGSPDRSYERLQGALQGETVKSQVLRHSRNFGSFEAIRTGMSASRGELIAVMAADLQEPAELIIEFFRALEGGEWDIAVGRRADRQDPLGAKVFSALYWGAYRKLIEPQIPKGGVDVFACTREVAMRLCAMREANSSLVGLLYWVGYRRVEVPYSRLAREKGTSAWSVKRKITYLTDSVFSFTSLPITLILVIGGLGTVISFIAAAFIFAFWLSGMIEVPGYTAQMLVQLLATGSLLFALGIVGTYVWRTYENSKSRPASIVMNTTSADS